ncbi:MAG: LysE family translocator [Chitinophagales bacterium]|nr:LysE family translocator [Chitinophagales bacterium]MDW8428139.1 LysE family transporter [Chitinophagales bacterium]
MGEMFYKGALLGLIAAFSLGPVFFGILDTGMRRGALFALAFALGVLISDLSVILFSFFSLSKWIRDAEVRLWIGAVGGMLLIWYGLYQLVKPIRLQTREIAIRSADLVLYIGKGFLMNTLNPFVYVFWIGAMSIVAVDPKYEEYHYLQFFAGTFGTIVLLDVVKSYFAARLQRVLTPPMVAAVTRAVGAGVVFFGVRLLWKALTF